MAQLWHNHRKSSQLFPWKCLGRRGEHQHHRWQRLAWTHLKFARSSTSINVSWATMLGTTPFCSSLSSLTSSTTTSDSDANQQEDRCTWATASIARKIAKPAVWRNNNFRQNFSKAIIKVDVIIYIYGEDIVHNNNTLAFGDQFHQKIGSQWSSTSGSTMAKDFCGFIIDLTDTSCLFTIHSIFHRRGDSDKMQQQKRRKK